MKTASSACLDVKVVPDLTRIDDVWEAQALRLRATLDERGILLNDGARATKDELDVAGEGLGTTRRRR